MQQVASYDFIMSVTVNSSKVPTPCPTPLPPHPQQCKTNTLQHIIQPRTIRVDIVTPRRKITATALRGPLQVSSTCLRFTVIAGTAGLGCDDSSCEVCVLVSSSFKHGIIWA